MQINKRVFKITIPEKREASEKALARKFSKKLSREEKTQKRSRESVATRGFSFCMFLSEEKGFSAHARKCKRQNSNIHKQSRRSLKATGNFFVCLNFSHSHMDKKRSYDKGYTSSDSLCDRLAHGVCNLLVDKRHGKNNCECRKSR